MHVNTFYSFKGGVGRTMALVNVAHALAERGRRVLLVDFDLEAPGVTSYIQLPCESRGLVDYVTDYLRTLVAPDLDGFVSQLPSKAGAAGEIFVMPAGAEDEGYARRLQQIDWRKLYDELDGYLLFENLREQWFARVKPDYVLIDSRTGHTDIGGICTRQLPDSVTLFFFPNEQNLQGLTRVAANIREVSGAEGDGRNVYCVMSNVPRLDDENLILERWTNRFKDALETEEIVTVHRYDSLDLLDQKIFVTDRSRTSLAREYSDVAKMIVRGNLSDREGALERLALFSEGELHFETITKIAEKHPRDPDVQFEVGRAWESLGAEPEAKMAFLRALELGNRTPAALLKQVELAGGEAKSVETIDTLKGILTTRSVSTYVLRRTLDLLQEHDGLSLEMADLPALQSAHRLASSGVLLRTRGGQELLVRLQEKWGERPDVLALIGTGRFGEAMRTIAERREDVFSMGVAERFNYSMASWAATGDVPVDILRTVAAEAEAGEPYDPNHFQCFGLADWLLERFALAKIRFDAARSRSLYAPPYVFSCWSYKELKYSAFIRELDVMSEQMEKGVRPSPPFICS